MSELETHFVIYSDYGHYKVKPNPDGGNYADGGALIRYEELDCKPIEMYVAPGEIKHLAEALMMAELIRAREASSE